MILDTILHADRYQHVDPAFAKALEFLYQNAENMELQDGKYEIIPDIATAFVVTKDTVPLDDAKMEIHKKFMDIHFMLKGAECCGFSTTFKETVPYDSVQDIAFSDCNDEMALTIVEGSFYAVWPGEAHRPLVQIGGTTESIRKIIVKVLLSDKGLL
ncbi:MAG: YhcH/YjgK/YiaL family protein [Sphaerochaeta sp.]